MNKCDSLSKMRLTNDIARFICNCIATYPLSLYYTKMQKFLVVAFEFHTTRHVVASEPQIDSGCR